MNGFRDPSLSLAESLIRSQAASKQQQQQQQQDSPNVSPPPPYTITISRQAGALGSSVAAEVGRRLAWPVYDKNILERLGEETHRHPRHLEGVDERATSWLEGCLAGLFDERRVGSGAYLKHLFAAVRGLGETGNCVIVGRGANFILPAETTLRVRLVARPEDRARVVERRFGLPAREAAAWLEKTERDRVAFVKAAFGRDPADPLHYDLVLNTSRLGVEEAAAVIIETLRGRLERREAERSASPVPA